MLITELLNNYSFHDSVVTKLSISDGNLTLN